MLIEREVRIRLETEYKSHKRPNSPVKEPVKPVIAKPLLILTEMPLDEMQEERKSVEPKQLPKLTR